MSHALDRLHNMATIMWSHILYMMSILHFEEFIYKRGIFMKDDH